MVGLQRSGTTLLQSLVGSHPRIAGPPEMYFLFRIVRLAERYGDLADDANLRRALHDTLHPPLEPFAECGFDDDAVFERAREKPRTMRGLFEAVMEDFAERHGKARWSDKSPGQSAGEIYKTFPDAQVIHIVRDPRDVVASSLEAPWIHEDAFGIAFEWRSFVRDNARNGLLAGPSHYLQVQYEQLTRDPASVMSRVCDFLRERFDPSMLTELERRRATVVERAAPWQKRALSPVAPASEGGWKRRLSRRDQLVVESLVAGELAALGYEPASARRRAAGAALGSRNRIVRRLRARKLRKQAREPGWRERMTDELMERGAASIGADPG